MKVFIINKILGYFFSWNKSVTTLLKDIILAFAGSQHKAADIWLCSESGIEGNRVFREASPSWIQFFVKEG